MNLKKIYFIGRSTKIISAFGKIFKAKKIEIIPWRGCENYNFKYYNVSKKDADIIVVCGYDYQSCLYEHSKYLRYNIEEPLKIINKISNSKTIIFYVNTDNSKRNETLSRYKYAKFLLGEKLSKKFKCYKNISLPVLLNNDGKADIYGGFIYKLIFNTLIYFNVLEVCNPAELNQIILHSMENSNYKKTKEIKPKFIKIRRTLFVDRLLRLIYG